MGAERALVQVLPRVAQDLHGLTVQVRAQREARMTLADLPEVLEPLSLIAVIEGPGEALGVMVLPPETLSALIEVQTMGALGKAAVVPRKPTRVDAAMAADFVDALLRGIEETLAGCDDIVWAGGFRYASYLDDPRPLGLMLEDVGYRVWTIEMGFGADGARGGQLLWAVPAAGAGQELLRRPETTRPTPAVAAANADWTRRMEATVMGTQAVLEAVLQRMTLPLSAVTGLREGMELPLPSDCLERIVLEGAGRRRLAIARLGQQRGQRAVRLVDEAAAVRTKAPPLFELAETPLPGKRAAQADPAMIRPSDLADDPVPIPARMMPAAAPTAPLDGFGAADEPETPPLRRVGQRE